MTRCRQGCGISGPLSGTPSEIELIDDNVCFCWEDGWEKKWHATTAHMCAVIVIMKPLERISYLCFLAFAFTKSSFSFFCARLPRRACSFSFAAEVQFHYAKSGASLCMLH